MEDKIPFRNREEFREWLKQNHNKSDGFWLVYYKTPEVETIRYEESLEEALCFGWIDNIIKNIDKKAYMRKFTPRRPNSNWSDKNKKIVERLIQEGKMTKWGLKAIEDAQKSGKWETKVLPEINEEQITLFETQIKSCSKAYQYFSNLTPSHKKQYLIYYYDAKKEETRLNRLKKIITMLENKKGFI